MSLPLPGDPGFRCAATSAVRGDGLAGTASTVRAFLLVEDAGPWGVDALRDARLPDGLGRELQRRCDRAKVRPLLVRRPGRSGRSSQDRHPGRRVFAAYADPAAPWLEATTVTDLHDVLDLDLVGLRAGRTAGLERSTEHVFCVCTHGKHDACCAERGRPAVTALAAAHPDETWEVSHIGGDRFSGNLLVLPHGLYYGRVDARSALEIGGAHLAGELTLDHLRGRSGVAMPVQFAEIALRRELGATRDDAVRFLSRTVDGPTTQARFALGATAYDVRVTTEHTTPARLTCGATRDNPVPVHRLREVRVVA